MENLSDRFFKGFSLEDYRLQVLVNTLEKEKKQCLSRLKEETHVFKMSIRLPVKSREEYWSQYGENYHANGDKREKGSVTHLRTEHKEELNKNNTTHYDRTNNPKVLLVSNRSIITPSAETTEYCGLNRHAERCYLQRIESKHNTVRKTDSAKRESKPPGLTLLEILCADFENGVLLPKKAGNHSDSGLGNETNNLSRDQRDENLRKVQRTGQKENSLLNFVASDKSLKSEKDSASSIRAQSSQERRPKAVVQSEVSGRSKSVSFAMHRLDDSPKTSPINTSNSQENIALQGRSAQNLNWSPAHSTNSLGLGEKGTSLQSTVSEISKHFESSGDSSATKNEDTGASYRDCIDSSLDARVSGNCRFVHFNDGRKLKKKKSKKLRYGFGADDSKDKLNRTESSDVRLFQVDVPQSSNRRKSQEEIAKETREKMDQFFAKVECTKSFQTNRPNWRCVSSSGERSARKNERITCPERIKRPAQGTKKEKGYRRAQPWPTQVWS